MDQREIIEWNRRVLTNENLSENKLILICEEEKYIVRSLLRNGNTGVKIKKGILGRRKKEPYLPKMEKVVISPEDQKTFFDLTSHKKLTFEEVFRVLFYNTFRLSELKWMYPFSTIHRVKYRISENTIFPPLRETLDEIIPLEKILNVHEVISRGRTGALSKNLRFMRMIDQPEYQGYQKEIAVSCTIMREYHIFTQLNNIMNHKQLNDLHNLLYFYQPINKFLTVCHNFVYTYYFAFDKDFLNHKDPFTGNVCLFQEKLDVSLEDFLHDIFYKEVERLVPPEKLIYVEEKEYWTYQPSIITEPGPFYGLDIGGIPMVKSVSHGGQLGNLDLPSSLILLKIVESVLIQIFYACHCAENYFQFRHFDLHFGNIMLKKIKSKDFDGQIFMFSDRDIFKIPKEFPYILKIIDFDLSFIKPNEKISKIGDGNIEVLTTVFRNIRMFHSKDMGNFNLNSETSDPIKILNQFMSMYSFEYINSSRRNLGFSRSLFKEVTTLGRKLIYKVKKERVNERMFYLNLIRFESFNKWRIQKIPENFNPNFIYRFFVPT